VTVAVFLDCQNTRCDFDFIRREIPHVNYVRDRTGSDVHVLVTQESSGAGGRTYTMEFIGAGIYADGSHTSLYVADATDTDNERRDGFTHALSRGLVPFLEKTAVADRIRIRIVEPVGETRLHAVSPEDDPWNFWVFDVGVDGNFEAEESSNSIRVNTRANADRTTEEWKLRARSRFTYRENNYDVEDGTISNIQRDGSLYGLIVKSLGDHWSAGGTVYSETSTRRNIEYSASVSPTIEYNLFPYSESSQRELRVQWELNFRHYNYDEVTVFEKTAETVMQQQLSVRFDLSRPWGSASANVQMESYLTDFDKSLTDLYKVEVGGRVFVRLVRGLSFNVGGNVSSIHDQIYLPQQDASAEDILLGRVSLPTSFAYEIDMGFSYRFGSIFNNVVNPRFGS